MLEEMIRKYALQNAVLHDGKADSGAVIGKVIASDPTLKSQAKNIMISIKSICDEVNGLSKEEQRGLLGELAPELLEKTKQLPFEYDTIEVDSASGSEKIQVEKKFSVDAILVRVRKLPPLPNVQNKIIMRFAPGPSGPLHIGHTRAAILNDEYVNVKYKELNGIYFIRLEDTNPMKIDPEAYDSIIEDIKWLGIKDFQVKIQSDRFEIYYEYAKKLLEMGKAYICSCNVEDWRNAKLKKKSCPHREIEIETQLEMWDRMLSGAFDEHEAFYVVKTDLSHSNPAVRDFVGFRIVKAIHPRTGDRYNVYPLYNFSVAIDDYLMGMTHVLRGKDHLNNTYRQEYIYDHFNWEKPIYIHYGLVKITDSILKTSIIKENIKKGDFSGWDDVRLATLKALAKRGINPIAIRNYWKWVAINEVDIEFSWNNLYSMNKEIIDTFSNRYFFVWNPKRLTIKGVTNLEGHAPLHPDHPERGIRKTILKGEDGILVLVTEDDMKKVEPGNKFRLKDLCNVKIISQNEAEYIGDDLSIIKEGVKIIHWVGEDNVPTKLYMPDGTVKVGVSEKIMDNDIGKVVQFERMGFVRIEEKDGGYEAYFAHR